jgi:hypothetical protein
MQYSPKLKKAAERIKAILKEHDIAGVVAIHEPGFSEFIIEVSPSYSCATFDPITGRLRVKSNLKEDYGGDLERKRKVDTNSANMLHLLAFTTFQIAEMLTKLDMVVSEKLNAEHYGDDEPSSHQSQNN